MQEAKPRPSARRRLFGWARRAAAGAIGAGTATVLFVAATMVLITVGLFSVGCAFTERVVDKTILNSPEMRFDYLDPDRDLQDITGTVAGGGGGGGGGC